LNVKSLEWEEVECKGKSPYKRAAFSIELSKDSFFIFGGFNGKHDCKDLV
jgi:hypothetical protein